MSRLRPIRTVFWRPRHTIGGLMATIVGVALVLAAVRFLAALLGPTHPALDAAIRRIATPEAGVVLACLAIGLFVTVKLMRADEA